MMAVSNIQIAPQVYAISDNNVYQLNPSDTVGAFSLASVRTKAITSNTVKRELKTQYMRAIFNEATIAAKATCTEYMNEKQGPPRDYMLQNTEGGISYPAAYPCYFASTDTVDNVKFDYSGSGNVGWKLAGLFSWGNDAKLLALQIEAEQQNKVASNKQQAKVYAS